MTTLRIPCFDLGDLPYSYLLPTPRAAVQTVPMSRILPTQAILTPARLAHYAARRRMIDDCGELPFGLRFKGSVTIYLIDGHHRWWTCCQRKRTRFRLVVDEYSYTLAQALVMAYEERRHHLRRRVSQPTPAQLQFQWVN